MPRSASEETSASGTWARKIDSQPSTCVRTPPTAGPSAAPRTPAVTQTRKRPLVASERPRQQVERGGDDQRGADRLNAAGADEHLERRCKPAGERRAREHERCPTANASRGRRRATYAAGTARTGEHEIERREHPGDRRDRDIELPEHVR